MGGACSLDDGTCAIAESAVTCTTQHGVYRGDNSVCVGGDQACTALINGGFELGTFDGWTQFGNTGHTGVEAGVSEAHSGRRAAFFGPVGTPGGIFQVVPAPIGAPLEVRFWYRSDGTPQSFSAGLGGHELVSFVDDTAHAAWTLFTFSMFAPVANPELRFTCQN